MINITINGHARCYSESTLPGSQSSQTGVESSPLHTFQILWEFLVLQLPFYRYPTDHLKTVKNIPSVERMKYHSLDLSFLVTITFQSCLSDGDWIWDIPDLFFFFLAILHSCWILVPRPGTETVAPLMEALGPNHWTTREVLPMHFNPWFIYILTFPSQN